MKYVSGCSEKCSRMMYHIMRNNFECDSYPEVCVKTIVYKGLPLYSYVYHRRKGIRIAKQVPIPKFMVVKEEKNYVIVRGNEPAIIIASNHYFSKPVVARFKRGYIVLSGSGDAYKFVAKYTDRAYGRDRIAFIDRDVDFI